MINVINTLMSPIINHSTDWILFWSGSRGDVHLLRCRRRLRPSDSVESPQKASFSTGFGHDLNMDRTLSSSSVSRQNLNTCGSSSAPECSEEDTIRISIEKADSDPTMSSQRSLTEYAIGTGSTRSVVSRYSWNKEDYNDECDRDMFTQTVPLLIGHDYADCIREQINWPIRAFVNNGFIRDRGTHFLHSQTHVNIQPPSSMYMRCFLTYKEHFLILYLYTFTVEEESRLSHRHVDIIKMLIKGDELLYILQELVEQSRFTNTHLGLCIL